MATKKKKPATASKPVKKAAKAKPVIKTGKSNEQTVRVIVEVIIRREDMLSDSNKNTFIPSFVAQPTGTMELLEANQPNFAYSFDLTNSRVLNMIVEDKSIDEPEDSGTFFTPVIDPNDPQKVLVRIVATQNGPLPSGSLSLKFKGKDLEDNPIPIVFKGGKGSINKLVNLPS